jgi:hypothetical protein
MNYGNYAPFYRSGYFNPMTGNQGQQPTPNMGDQNQFVQPFGNGQFGGTVPTITPINNTQPQTNSGFIWVQGEEGAKAFLVAPNNTVTLWDSENPTIYVKSADMNGIPSMRVLDFTERTANAPKAEKEHVCQCGKDFVKIDTFNELQAKFDDLAKKFEIFSQKTPSKSTKTKTEEE